MPAVRAQRIGLTGGIGSGKSTVARLLLARGAVLVDADALSRQSTAAKGAAIPEIARRFGSQTIAPDGALDRDAMRALVFSNPAARRQLEAIVHPLVSQAAAQQAAAAVRDGSRCIVFDIPLLVESGRWRQQLDRVLVVDCSEATQLNRVVAREAGRWTPEAVRQVMAGQASRLQRLAAADLCLYNDGLSLEELGAIVSQMATGFGL